MSILSADIISECVTFAETVGRSGNRVNGGLELHRKCAI